MVTVRYSHSYRVSSITYYVSPRNSWQLPYEVISLALFKLRLNILLIMYTVIASFSSPPLLHQYTLLCHILEELDDGGPVEGLTSSL